MAVNPSAFGFVSIPTSGSISIPASDSIPILAFVGSCIFFLFLRHFSVLMEGNPSKSAVMAPVARDIAEMGVDPIVRVSLSSFESKCFDIFHFPGWFVVKDALRHVERNPMTLPFPMENNTMFITLILLSPTPPNPPPTITAEIVKGGETRNAARNATIASMRRKPRSVSVHGWRNWRIEIMRRS
ncbi:hypothetical protein SLEP1_g14944 [Rubroshorea leprosula]|uniref:Uncharacterized protein n=1 Tax=Rubroshorea leprosula TaxID=152421 RepID=A0AAV5IKS4_9ROSI|nr:hypothetical protein SLEP1_g14944 [Rubroshorea leprosula]